MDMDPATVFCVIITPPTAKSDVISWSENTRMFCKSWRRV